MENATAQQYTHPQLQLIFLHYERVELKNHFSI